MRRLILPLLIALLPAPLFAQSVILGEYRPGQATMSASLPVVIASNQTTVPVSISGTLPVSIAGTVAISAASLPLPSGAATETTLSGILTTEQSALTSLQTLDNIVLAEDGVHVSGESGVLVLGVRNDAGTALAADGDRIPLSIDSSGAVRVTGGGGGTQYTEADTDASITGTAILWEDTSDTLRSVSAAKPLPVTCATCSGTGVQHIDDAAFTPATDDGVPIFGMFDDVAPDSVNEGDGGVVRMSGNRNLYVQIRDNAGNERGLNIDSSGALAIGTVPSNMSVNIAQIAGSTASATNPLFVRPTDGTTAQTWSALDLDSGAGTVTRIAVGVAGAASGGPVAIPGTTANGLTVDVTRVQGTVTVDSELTAASALADATANPTVPAIAAYVMAYNGSTWDRARSSTITEATQDGALTIASTVGNVNVLRASTTAPTSVSANDDAVLQWGLRTGATVTTPFDSGGTDMTDTTNHAIKVNIVAGSAAGGTSSNFGSAFPGTGTGAGFSDGTNMQGARVVDADTGAGTAYTLLSNLVRRASGGPVELIGSSTSANSIPVVIASDQAAVTVAATNLSTNLAQVGGTNTVTGGVSGLLAVAGNVAHDAAVTANPLLMGGYASAAAPTDVSADGDAVRAWFLRSGAQVTQPTFSGTLAAVNNGAASAGTLRVTVANDSTGILASIGTITTSITPGTSAGHLGKAEDAAHSSGDTGVMILTKRTDSAATSAGTDGDYATLNTDASGRLWVNCATGCGGSGGTSIADNGAFTFGTTTITPAGGVFDDVATNAVTENSSAAFRMSSRREMYTQIRDAAGNERGVNVDSSNQMLVSAVVSSFPANQPFNLAQYGGSSVVTGGTAGTLGIAGIQAHDAAISGNNPILNGAYASAAVPTDVSADGDLVRLWALRSGALAQQPTFAGVLAVAGNGASGTGVQRVTIANDSTGILAAVTSITNAVTVVGNAAHDAVASGNPILNAAYASAAAPSDVSADGDVVRLWALRSGASVTQPSFAGVLASTGVGASGTGVQRVVDVASGTTGSAPPTQASYVAGITSGATGGLLSAGITVCDSSGYLDMTTATTTEIAPLVSSRTIRVCQIVAVSNGTTTMTLKRGTGTNCGTGTASVSPAFDLTAQTGFSAGSGFGEVIGAAGAGTVGGAMTSGNALCVTNSAAVNLHVMIRYAVY
jgi:hypothetical protein